MDENEKRQLENSLITEKEVEKNVTETDVSTEKIPHDSGKRKKIIIRKKAQESYVQKIVDENITIYEALKNIECGKYVMPAFQRQFVWSMGQIEKLWDSILLGYPISSFLFWHIDNQNISTDTYFCEFLKRASFSSKKEATSLNYNITTVSPYITDTAILDGQQRLTSLYLSLFSDDIYIKQKFEHGVGGKLAKLLIELDESKIENEDNEFDTKQYDIHFTDKIFRISSTQFDFRKLITNPAFKETSEREKAIQEVLKRVPESSKNYAKSVLNKLCEKIFDEKLIRYTEVFGMEQDDALEMFVRFNSGGKPLKKSDITMSILEVYWSSAKTEFGYVLEKDYKGFGTDFIIRTALMLYGDVVKSNINKKTADTLHNNWADFKKALLNLVTFLKSMNIDIKHFKSSWNILLPIIFCIYNNPDYENDKDAMRAYLVRGALFTYFKSGTTGKLSQIRGKIIECDYRITFDILNNMNELRVTDARIEDLVNLEYGSKVVSEVLYYLSLNWHKENITYAVDHLHPESVFDTKPITITNMSIWQECRKNRNRLPNLDYLESSTNEMKNNTSLLEFFNDMTDIEKSNFRKRALIPENVSLELSNFEEFYEKRKILLIQEIKKILS